MSALTGGMMRTLKIIFFIMLVAVAFSSNGYASNQMKITVFTDATWPPMEMLTINNKVVGFEIDLMEAIAKEAGFKVEFKNVSWDDIFAALRSPKYPNSCAMSSITITDARKKSYDFSKPYFAINQDMIVPETLKIKDMNDMKGRKVAAQFSSTGAVELKKYKDIIMKPYDDIGIAFVDMAAGRIDGVLCDTPVAKNYAFHKKEYKGKFKVGYAINTNEQLGIMVKKGDNKILDLINKGIDAVKTKGLDKKIIEKWM
jgi:polar amino acid transport system substrate-binding protein